jgi:putative DNA primase/helicase
VRGAPILPLARSNFSRTDRKQWFRPGRAADDYRRAALNATWTGPDEQCPLWLDFLPKIMCGDDEIIEYLQELFGSTLVGKTYDHTLHSMRGEGSNGKSVLLHVLSKILHPFFATLDKEVLLNANRDSSAGAASPHLAVLHGLRSGWVSESKQNKTLAEAQVKKLTGGDKIRARDLYKASIEWQPTHKLMLATNHKPYVRGTDNGVWRRLRIVPFNACFTSDAINNAPHTYPIDTEMGAKLVEQSPGILAWLVRGAERWWARKGLPPAPAGIAAATNE